MHFGMRPSALRRICFVPAMLAGFTAAQAQITIDVTPSLAPNAFGSPNWNGYVSNSVYALMNGLSTYGSAGSPDYYSTIIGPIQARDNIVTGFNSWRGDANPGVTYGAAYAGEYGTRVHFGLHIDGHGTQFSIADMSITMSSSDPGNGLGWTFAAGSYNYSSSYVGVIHDPSGDIFVTSGPNTQLVDELFARGSGNAYDVYMSDPGATPQDKIDQMSLARRPPQVRLDESMTIHSPLRDRSTYT